MDIGEPGDVGGLSIGVSGPRWLPGLKQNGGRAGDRELEESLSSPKERCLSPGSIADLGRCLLTPE